MAKKRTSTPNKLVGKVSEKPLDVHNNYNYDNKSVGTADHLVFKRGNESVSVGLSHPHVEELKESDPRWNEEWVPGTGSFSNNDNSREQYQRTLWDKPYGRSTPATITGLFATPGARTDVGTAIGAAVEHSIKKFGTIPKSSGDLSPQSHALVTRIAGAAKDKGIKDVDRHISYAPTNDITKEEGAESASRSASAVFDPEHYDHKYYKDIPEEQIKSGSRLMRGIFAGRHLNKQQFTQPELPLGGN